MKEDIKNTSDSSKETRNVFIGAKVTPTQKEQIKSLAGQCGMTVSDYILSRAYNFKPKARLTKEEAVLLQKARYFRCRTLRPGSGPVRRADAGNGRIR